MSSGDTETREQSLRNQLAHYKASSEVLTREIIELRTRLGKVGPLTLPLWVLHLGSPLGLALASVILGAVMSDNVRLSNTIIERGSIAALIWAAALVVLHMWLLPEKKEVRMSITSKTDELELVDREIKAITSLLASLPPSANRVRSPESSTYIDLRDGQEYKVVRLRDGKRWFAENLRFAGSQSQPPESDAVSTGDAAEQRDSARPGRTYRFQDAIQACPPGWHLPTYAEWTAMLKAYGQIETKEWIGGSKLRTNTVKELASDGFNPIGTGRLWISTTPPGLLGRSSATQIKGSGGEIADVAYFVCFTDNVYIHAEKISSWYSLRCIED